MSGTSDTIDAVYRAESRRVLATLVRLLGDLDLAEEALHDAFRAAVEQWPRDGVPEARDAAATDWAQIVALYDVLLRVEPTPVVELNRAVAVAMRDGPAVGLESVEALLGRGELEDYHLAHAARADLCRRLGRTADAREAYERALTLTQLEPERRFLERRMKELAE